MRESGDCVTSGHGAPQAPRILLFTGKGGVGKSTVAAGTAALAAASGLRTLVVSTDTAHSLGDALSVAAQADPTPAAPQLWVQHIDAQRRFEESWSEIQGYLREVMRAAGVDGVEAEELTVLPGAEEVLALLELKRQAESGDFDVIVVDCAPTAETLRLLALPEALAWYMDRLFPTGRRVMKTLGPVLGRAVGVPMPADGVLGAVERLHHDLGSVRELLAGASSTVRLVMTPEEVVLAEARRSWTSLSLYGYRVDGVIVNRVFDQVPDEDQPPSRAARWLRGWVAAQRRVLDQTHDSFAPLPIWRSAYAEAEPRGSEMLAAVARSLYGGDDPLGVPDDLGVMEVDVDDERGTLILPLPLADRTQVGLARSGRDLVITCGSYRRVLALPAALAPMRVRGGSVAGGRITVRFERKDEDD